MPGTVETLPLEVQRWVRRALVAAKVVGVLSSALVAAVVAVRSAAGDAAARAQVVKDKAEAGYQVTRPKVEDLEHRVAELEQTVRQLARQQRPPARAGSKPRAPAAVPPAPPPPKALPPDLDQAQRQVYRGAAPAPAPARDGGP